MIAVSRHTLTTDPSEVVAFDPDDERSGTHVALRNRGDASILIGGQDEATTEWWELSPGETFTIDLERGEEIWAAAVSGSQRVDVLIGGS